MDWLLQAWIWVRVFAAFIGMRQFGRRGHGGHGGCCGGDGQCPTDGEQPGKDRLQGHLHCEGVAMLNIKVVSWALCLWSALTFVVCVFYGLATPEALHRHAFLEQVLPGFKWLTW